MSIEAGSISTDTLRARDLIPKYLAFLPEGEAKQEQESRWNELFSHDEDEDGANEQIDYLLEDLTAALEKIAPKGMYFGSLEGDTADIGFWTIEEEDACDGCGRVDPCGIHYTDCTLLELGDYVVERGFIGPAEDTARIYEGTPT